MEAALDRELILPLGVLERLGRREVVNRHCRLAGTTQEDLGPVTEVLVLNRPPAPQPLVHVETWLAGTALPDPRFVGLPESGGGVLISGEPLPSGSVYTIGSDPSDRKLALFLLQTQVNPGSGRVIPLGNLSPIMSEALKAADAYLRAHMRDLGIDRDPR